MIVLLTLSLIVLLTLSSIVLLTLSYGTMYFFLTTRSFLLIMLIFIGLLHETNNGKFELALLNSLRKLRVSPLLHTVTATTLTETVSPSAVIGITYIEHRTAVPH